MSKAKVYKSLRSVAYNPREIVEEDQLDSKPANLKCYMCCSQKDAGKLDQVLDVHGSTLALCIAQTFLIGHNLDNPRPR